MRNFVLKSLINERTRRFYARSTKGGGGREWSVDSRSSIFVNRPHSIDHVLYGTYTYIIRTLVTTRQYISVVLWSPDDLWKPKQFHLWLGNIVLKNKNQKMPRCSWRALPIVLPIQVRPGGFDWCFTIESRVWLMYRGYQYGVWVCFCPCLPCFLCVCCYQFLLMARFPDGFTIFRLTVQGWSECRATDTNSPWF